MIALLVWLVLAGVGALAVRMRPYLVAKYRGRRADLEEAVLVHASLPGAILVLAILQRAHLEGVNFYGAHLEGANPRGANLEDANLQNAYLEVAILRSAKLCRANLSGATMEMIYGADADLRGVDLRATISPTPVTTLAPAGPPASIRRSTAQFS
jgi:uncharacterized protein YjbI with pentapeptide repeats